MNGKLKEMLIFLLISIALLSGCRQNEFETGIVSSIDRYASVMSSVPGFPLEALLPEGGDSSDYICLWETDKGEFLFWGSDWKVSKQGSKATTTGGIIYWSALTEDGILAENARIDLTVKRADTGRIASRTSIVIEYGDDGMFRLGDGPD
ncbi:MAG: hypothetical protein JXB33_02830 [Clostridia bacterium]|nr:hypothetical protein [Clostridia bacterium]